MDVAHPDSSPERIPRAASVRAATRRLRPVRWFLVSCLALVVLTVVAFVSYRIGLRVALSAEASAAADAGGWTCSMHPQIKLPKPGKCPICFMDLIPVGADDETSHARELKMSESAVRLAEIQTVAVQREHVASTIRMVGKVDYDETRLASIAAWFPGRLERLYVDYTGVTVRKGDHLFEIYSPNMVIAQEELLQAVRDLGTPSLNQAKQSTLRRVRLSEEKLELLGLLPRQIDELKRRGKATDRITIYAPTGGIVIQKHASEGMYVKMGTHIYTIADLSQVWIDLDAYESDLPWLRYGQQVRFTTETYSGESFQGQIVFIDPVLDETTRTVKVRVNVSNKDLRLKPGMFVRAEVTSRIAHGGLVIEPSLEGKWISPMHPEIIKDGPGKCDICGMDLVPAEQLGYIAADPNTPPPLVIPVTAPLLTGKRAIVYVRVDQHEGATFRGREVTLGPRAGDYYIVREGLEEGEEVVTNGNFKIDADLQIRGRPSMMSEAGQRQTPNIPESFRRQLDGLLISYLQLHEAMATDNQADRKTAVQTMRERSSAVDPSPLDESLREDWLASHRQLTKHIEAAAALTASDHPAETFEPIAQWALDTVEQFGHSQSQSLHKVHCSMAFEGRGAFWLQKDQTVANPFFRGKMPVCGQIKRTYAPAQPVKEQLR